MQRGITVDVAAVVGEEGELAVLILAAGLVLQEVEGGVGGVYQGQVWFRDAGGVLRVRGGEGEVVFAEPGVGFCV